MLSEHARHEGSGMDALVIACTRNTNVVMAWACQVLVRAERRRRQTMTKISAGIARRSEGAPPTTIVSWGCIRVTVFACRVAFTYFAGLWVG